MTDWEKFFQGKRITVMGLGLLGRGAGDIEFLAKFAKEIIVTDLKSAKELAESITRLKKFKNIKYRLGEHLLEDFENRDFVVKAAGVPLDSVYIAHARRKKVPVYMSTALFVKFSRARTIGITGTRGKTTTAYMIYEILRRARRGKKQKIFLGGNILGVSTLAMLPKTKKGDLVVLELDSWQLQGFGDLKISPSVAVFTTFMPDHLNYYKGDLRQYFADKANIFKYQKQGEIFIAGKQVKKIGRAYPLPKSIVLQIPGEHNRYNAGLAYALAKKLKINPKVIQQSLENFKGVPGRLEKVRTFKGIEIYNDTTSTTPHALAAAVEALKNKKIVLIAGGTEKKLDLKILKKPFKNCKEVILLPGSGTDILINEKLVQKAIFARSLKQAVTLALSKAKRGEVILFSPGFTSFGSFKNEYDRGDQFDAIVKSLHA